VNRARARANPELRAIYDRQIRERGFRKDPAQLAAVAALEDLRSRLMAAGNAAPSRPSRLLSKLKLTRAHAERGLYLWGGVGRGKTWLMDLFFHSLPFPEKRRRHFHRFMHDVHGQLKKLARRQAPLEQVAANIASETRVICFDELFVTDIADAMILGTLFDGLFKRGVTLVATSNVPPRDLYREGLQRVRFLPAIELLEQNTQVLAVEGNTDYRLRQLTQAGTYLDSAAPDTPARLEALFNELADGAESDTTPVSSGALSSTAKTARSSGPPSDSDKTAVSSGAPSSTAKTARSSGARASASTHDSPDVSASTAVEIAGRLIPIIREGANVIWFDFESICEGPRSQNDYIEIARDYQSVIVSNVPRFTSQRENAARRFIALVDELYDHNVNLVVSAAARPDDLYHGERLTFEFRRATSRLIEMQTEEYLAREHRA
jgi:cell division protein ZapE